MKISLAGPWTLIAPPAGILIWVIPLAGILGLMSVTRRPPLVRVWRRLVPLVRDRGRLVPLVRRRRVPLAGVRDSLARTTPLIGGLICLSSPAIRRGRRGGRLRRPLVAVRDGGGGAEGPRREEVPTGDYTHPERTRAWDLGQQLGSDGEPHLVYGREHGAACSVHRHAGAHRANPSLLEDDGVLELCIILDRRRDTDPV